MRRLSTVLTRLATTAVMGALVLLAVVPAASAAGPTMVRDIYLAGSSNPTHLTAVGSTLFFAAYDSVHGNELWKSDGTVAGTKMVKNIRPLGKSSNPENLVAVGNTLFFTAIDGVHGRELWKSDGTKAGTVMVKDLTTGKKGSYGGNSTYLHEGGALAVGSQLFFLVDFCCVGSAGLFVSDGTAAGTREVAGDPWIWLPDGEDWWQNGMTSSGTAGGKFYFVATSSDFGSDYQVWVSDGTGAGTHPVAGSPTAEQMSIFPTNGGKLYFYTDRVWRSDGTAAGTIALTGVGLPSSAPTESKYMGSRIYFNGGALWRTDGTAAGTKSVSNGDATWLAVAGGRVYFVRSSHLWKSDGTAAGTTDLGPVGVYGPSHLIGVGSKVCFAAMGNNGWALWASDGTALATYQVRSFWGTPEAMNPVAVGSRLFFAADDGIHGTELWSYTP